MAISPPNFALVTRIFFLIYLFSLRNLADLHLFLNIKSVTDIRIKVDVHVYNRCTKVTTKDLVLSSEKYFKHYIYKLCCK